MYMAVASPSVSGLVAIMTSFTSPWPMRSISSRILMSSWVTRFRGEITPWSTWYTPRYSRERSRAITSLGSATTQMVLLSRLSSAQMGHRGRSVRFWQQGQVCTLRLASRMASAKPWASSMGISST